MKDKLKLIGQFVYFFIVSVPLACIVYVTAIILQNTFKICKKIR